MATRESNERFSQEVQKASQDALEKGVPKTVVDELKGAIAGRLNTVLSEIERSMMQQAREDGRKVDHTRLNHDAFEDLDPSNLWSWGNFLENFLNERESLSDKQKETLRSLAHWNAMLVHSLESFQRYHVDPDPPPPTEHGYNEWLGRQARKKGWSP